MSLAGIVLAGGASRRLSGVDKPMLDVGGIPLLRKAVSALRAADPVVVVGPERSGISGVRWAREDPPGGGPVAALAAGLALVDTRLVAVLAGDLAGVEPSTVDRLVAAVGDADGAVLVDSEGKRQWLLGAWRVAALRGALPAHPSGAALRRTLAPLSIVEVPERPGESVDVDTPEDLDNLRKRR
jgi:molybdopterin-guanine dinucleotide biosynthesis protein A